MKKALIVLGVIGLAASLQAQSLADLAKREKARREGFQGRQVVVVRNRDLLLVKKVPAVEVTNAGAEAGEIAEQTEPQLGAGEAPAPSKAPPEEIAPAGPDEGGVPAPQADMAAEDIPDGGGPLEEQLRAIDEVVETLTTEMNSLQQQYQAQNNMVPGYVIQQQIEELYPRLVRAQNRQAAIRAKMGSKAPPLKKDPGLPDR